jgi:hypothetical protein
MRMLRLPGRPLRQMQLVLLYPLTQIVIPNHKLRRTELFRHHRLSPNPLFYRDQNLRLSQLAPPIVRIVRLLPTYSQIRLPPQSTMTIFLQMRLYISPRYPPTPFKSFLPTCMTLPRSRPRRRRHPQPLRLSGASASPSSSRGSWRDLSFDGSHNIL